MRKTLIICLAVVAALGSSLSAADREHEQLMADLRMLQEQTLRLHQMIGGLESVFATLTTRLDDQSVAMQTAFADQRLTTESVASGVRILREKLDETNVRLSSLSQEVEALRVSIPPPAPVPLQLLVDPETGLPMSNAPTEVGETPEGAPTADASAAPPPPPVFAAAPPGVSPRRMYDTAWSDYTSGQWGLAIQGFEAYIENFPRSELTDDASFYIGQTHFAEGSFEDAVAAFEQVLLNYPDGNIVPEASYKRGLALDRLGQTDRARQAFERVAENYSDHMMAILAQQALDRLSQP
jgi:tol-pal system protein YbgF